MQCEGVTTTETAEIYPHGAKNNFVLWIPDFHEKEGLAIPNFGKRWGDGGQTFRNLPPRS